MCDSSKLSALLGQAPCATTVVPNAKEPVPRSSTAMSRQAFCYSLPLGSPSAGVGVRCKSLSLYCICSTAEIHISVMSPTHICSAQSENPQIVHTICRLVHNLQIAQRSLRNMIICTSSLPTLSLITSHSRITATRFNVLLSTSYSMIISEKWCTTRFPTIKWCHGVFNGTASSTTM